MDIGDGSSPSRFLGGVLNFCEPGDILTGLNGVLLVVPDVLAEVVMVLGLEIPKPLMVGGGVANFAAVSAIFSSTSSNNCFSFSSDVISLAEPRFFDHGVETIESNPPDEFCIEDIGEREQGNRYKEGEVGDLEGLLVGYILFPSPGLELFAIIRDERFELVIG